MTPRNRRYYEFDEAKEIAMEIFQITFNEGADGITGYLDSYSYERNPKGIFDPFSLTAGINLVLDAEMYILDAMKGQEAKF